MKIHHLLPMAFLLLAASCSKTSNTIDLSGTWQASLDSLETFQAMQLPGTTDLAGLGTPNTLEPGITYPQINRLTRKNSFIGAAFYKREFDVPNALAGKTLELKLERVIWQSSVWVDGMQLEGAEESLTTPHHYIIPGGLGAGKHEIMLRIDNRKRYDLSWSDLAHAYTNDTQIMWNGVLGEISLTALEAVEVAQVQVYPNVDEGTATVRTTLVRHGASDSSVKLEICVDGKGKTSQTAELTGEKTVIETVCKVPGELWDEFNPALHKIEVKCGKDVKKVSFGMRSFVAEKTVPGENGNAKFRVNGRRIFLRGTLDCCIFPLTGNPPLDEAGWEKEFNVCREWGLNHIRFHSWCPPDAAFRVADRMGFYLQVELPNWSKTMGQEDIDNFMWAEYDRIVEAYGNHPSFCMLSGGNELDRGYDFLNELLRHMKATDPRHEYTNSTYSMGGGGHKGRPEPEDEYFIVSTTIHGKIRGQDYFDKFEPNFSKDYSTTAGDFGIPLLSHEIGQYSVYPHLSEIDKYTGTLDPLNFKGVRNIMESKGLLDKAEDWTMASGRLGAILYKEEVEWALKTPQLGGFQLLGLQDFSGQSTALVGLVDAFWDNKGLVSEEWFRQASAPVTPLARFSKAVWTNDETFTADLEFANYWKKDISADVTWTLTNGSDVIAKGSTKAEIPTGGNTKIAEKVSASLKGISQASELTLTAALKGTEWSNSWKIWVYPSEQEIDLGDVNIATSLEEAYAVLSEGGTVLFNPNFKELDGEKGKFVPVFWSPVFFPREAGTMGLLCDPKHPALAGFPTEMHSNWQWWRLVKNSKALNLDPTPEIKAIVEAVDNFSMNRRLAYIFEAQCESGRLIFSSIDLVSDEARMRPEARQLLASMVDYMNSAEFNPTTVMERSELEAFFIK